MRNLHNWLVKQLVLSVLLLLSQEEVTQEEIENACRNANILEFIEGLPQYVVAFSAEEVLWRLISFLGALIPRLVERACSYLVDRNAKVCIFFFDQMQSNHYLSK